MSTTYGSGGYVTKTNNSTLSYVLPKGTLVSARVKFRGKAVSFYDYQTTSDSESGSGSPGITTSMGLMVSYPTGYTFLSGLATSTVSSGGSDTYSVSASIGGAVASQSGSGTGATVTANAFVSATSSQHSALHVTAYTYAFSISTQWRKLLTSQTHDPHVHIGASQYGYTGDLNNGVETGWYDIAASVSPDSTVTLTINVDGSLVGAPDAVDVYVEIIVTAALGAEQVTPINLDTKARSALAFELDPVQDAGCTDTVWFPRIQANRTNVWTSPEFDLNSKLDQAGWTYWNGAAWVALPVGGAPVTARCRYVSPVPGAWATRWFYWRACSWDADIADYGDWSATRQLRVILSVAQRFALVDSAATDWTANAFGVKTRQTTNGELGWMRFSLADVASSEMPMRGEEMTLAIRDGDGNQKQFTGWVEGDPARIDANVFAYDCYLPDAKLVHRMIVTTATCSQDYGQHLYDLVSLYATDLDPSGINVSLGLAGPMDVLGKTLMDAFKFVRPLVHAMFWVAADTDPPKTWMMKTTDMPVSSYCAIRGQVAP